MFNRPWRPEADNRFQALLAQVKRELRLDGLKGPSNEPSTVRKGGPKSQKPD